MKNKQNKAGPVRYKETEYVVRIQDLEGRVPTPEELARAICIAADKRAGIVRRKE